MSASELAQGSGGLNTRVAAAHYLKASVRRIDELIKTGALNAVRDGRTVKITTAELERYIGSLPTVAKTDLGGDAA